MLTQTQEREISSREMDAIVIGGGIGGLIAANLIAQEGRSVVVLERSRNWGGRACTQVKHDVAFNMGAHALYCHGHAFQLLTEMQVPFTGRYPSAGKSTVLSLDAEYPMPVDLRSILTSRFLTWWEKWRLVRFFQRILKTDTSRLHDVPLSQWIAEQVGTGRLNQYLKTVFRLNTFVADLDRLSAGAAIEQLKIGITGNVWYLDNGWQTVVDGLQARGGQLGVEFRSGASVEAVRSVGGGVVVQLVNGEVLRAHTAVLAVPPKAACEVLDLRGDSQLSRWLTRSHSVHAACLDIALDKLSRPEHRFALGLDSPVYFSVHSAAAKLAPDGVHTIHLFKYLTDDDRTGAAVEGELEGMLDRVQPGWRSHVVERRFLPNMVVSYALPAAADGGLQGRPSVQAEGHPGVFLVGDWVGPRGMLVDASAASAEEAAKAVLQRLAQYEPVAVV